jgi:hypothetical protein
MVGLVEGVISTKENCEAIIETYANKYERNKSPETKPLNSRALSLPRAEGQRRY